MPSPFVSVTLDKPRTLLCDFEACESMESALSGTPLLDVVAKLRGVSLPTLCVALWVCLKHEDKSLTLSLMKKIVKECLKNGATYMELSVPVVEAIDCSGLFNKPEVDEPGNATAAGA